MLALLIGVLLFVLLYFGARYLAGADTNALARAIRRYSWVALFILAGLLLLPALLVIAIPLAAIGYSLLRRQGGIRFGGTFGGPFGGAGLGGAQQHRRSAGQKSVVRTASLEMELDHDTGQVEGRCLRGRFAGRALSSMSLSEVKELASELNRSGDPQEMTLIMAYMERRWPGWQTGMGGEGQQRTGHGHAGGGRSRASGQMSVDEACEVLGVSRSATKEDIRSAHRKLMKQVHPDRGGSTYLAARINEAKDVLLSVL